MIRAGALRARALQRGVEAAARRWSELDAEARGHAARAVALDEAARTSAASRAAAWRARAPTSGREGPERDAALVEGRRRLEALGSEAADAGAQADAAARSRRAAAAALGRALVRRRVLTGGAWP